MKQRVALTFLFSLLLVCFFAPCCQAVEIVIVADEKLRPVVEIISGIKKTVSATTKIISPTDLRGKLRSIAEKEGAKVVVALGREALTEALQLPPEIPVIYGLVVTPPKIGRANVTGFYMATPVRQYLDLINSHLRSIKRITVIGNRDQLNVLVGEATQQISHQGVRNSFEFVNTLRQTNGMDAVLLLPDVSILTAATMEEAYLLSFRKRIPILGISEKQVKEGALLALLADAVHVGRQVGEYASKALKGVPIGQLPPSPPRHFELFLNTETARKMGIRIPDELLRMAKRVYTSRSEAAETIIVADRQLRPVVEIISGIRKTLTATTSVYSPAEVQGKLLGIVEKEKAKVVVALGSEALKEALQLPAEIPVIYDLVVIPPKVGRANVTGFYMATPVSQYLELINTHLRSIKRIAVIGNRDQLNILAGEATQQISPQSVRNSFEFVNTLRQTNGMDAVLLLPDVSLLTAATMEEAYLLSFRKKIPLLGISEKQVKEGALLALVADTVHVGRQIGEYASKALKGVPIGQLPPSPPRRFELFLNTETARKMGIRIPDELLRMAKRVYP